MSAQPRWGPDSEHITTVAGHAHSSGKLTVRVIQEHDESWAVWRNAGSGVGEQYGRWVCVLAGSTKQLAIVEGARVFEVLRGQLGLTPVEPEVEEPAELAEPYDLLCEDGTIFTVFATPRAPYGHTTVAWTSGPEEDGELKCGDVGTAVRMAKVSARKHHGGVRQQRPAAGASASRRSR